MSDLGIPEESVLHRTEIIEACQDDLVALMQAWMDRGISIPEAAQLYAAAGIALLAKIGYSTDEILGFVLKHVANGREYRG